jgi:hypothetical protein
MSITKQFRAAISGLLDGREIDENERDLVRAYLAEEPQPVMADLADEVGFRTHVPDVVAGYRILQVSHFQPGIAGSLNPAALNPTAVVIAQDADEQRARTFSVHTLIYRPDVSAWALDRGRHDIADRDMAEGCAFSRGCRQA